jgi:death on curing protein
VTEYIDPEQALAAADYLGLHVRDRGLLFSALARPATSAFGDDAYETLELKAAALLSSLGTNQAMIDGNKRFSWFLTLAFLRLNGYRVVMSNDDAFNLVLAVAQGAQDLDEIALRLRTHMVSYPR